ncbi:beta-ketoacyl-[acyl-carrier-protein] synthase II, partial [Fischerella thermalis CCMEE 5319]
MTQARRVVITGVGAITPIGNTAQEYLSGLKNGVSGASFISAFDTEKFKTRFACEVKNFDVNQFIDRKEARRMDRFTHFALVCADE